MKKLFNMYDTITLESCKELYKRLAITIDTITPNKSNVTLSAIYADEEHMFESFTIPMVDNKLRKLILNDSFMYTPPAIDSLSETLLEIRIMDVMIFKRFASLFTLIDVDKEIDISSVYYKNKCIVDNFRSITRTELMEKMFEALLTDSLNFEIDEVDEVEHENEKYLTEMYGLDAGEISLIHDLDITFYDEFQECNFTLKHLTLKRHDEKVTKEILLGDLRPSLRDRILDKICCEIDNPKIIDKLN